MDEQPILVVEHEAQCPAGWMGEWLTDAGCVLDVRRPYAGEPLPHDLTRHDGMVVLGGSMDADADEDHAWLTEVKSLIVGAVADGPPVLGICLGHQLIAVALGGRVERNPRGQQIGVFDAGWVPEVTDDPLFSAVAGPAPAVQWNNDIVTEPPATADVLAATPAGEIQAARFGPRMWGVQWHPEAGEQIISAWAENDRDDAQERGLDIDEYVASVAAAEPMLRETWRRLADRFATLCREPVRSR